MEFKITIKIDAELGTLNAYELCHTIQEKLIKDSIVHKKKIAKVIGYKMKANEYNSYVLEDGEISFAKKMLERENNNEG